MSSSEFSGTAELEGSFYVMVDCGKFSVEDFDVDSIRCWSDEDVDLEKSDYDDYIYDFYADIIADVKSELEAQGTVIDDNTNLDIEGDFQIEIEYSGYWDEGYFHNYDDWEPSGGELNIDDYSVDAGIVSVTAVEVD